LNGGLGLDQGGEAGQNSEMEIESKRVELLGVGISEINLESATEQILERLRSKQKGYICVTGVHGVIEAQDDSKFRTILNRSFLTTPDGMPMVWVSWALKRWNVDRVYGPDLMLKIAEATQDGKFTHFFYGGRPGIAELLKQKMEERFPGIRIVGTYTPPFGPLSIEQEKALAEEFQALRPDMTWVGLSTPKQEKFMAEYLPKLNTTLMCGVGAAFDFHSMVVKQAPRWIQRSGFEWLYRTIQEPRRLLARYLKNNTRFLWRYGLSLVGLEPHRKEEGVSIAFLGCRGVPARYSGFETLVEELGARLAERGHAVTVYNRAHLYPDRPKEVRGMRIAYLPSLRTKSTETISHTLLAVIHAAVRRFDVVYLCGVGNAALAGILKLAGSKVIVNVDGDDFRRLKWHPFAKAWLKLSERWATKLSDVVIADNQTVMERYEREYGFKTTYLSYGTPERPKECGQETLKLFGLKAGEYVLYAGRLTPENRPDLLVKAYGKVAGDWPCVVVGGAGYEVEYGLNLHQMAGAKVKLVGPIYGEGYRELSAQCGIFVLPGTVEATRLVLLDQMGFGSAIVYHDCAATREVIGEAGVSFGGENPEKDLAEKLNGLIGNPGEREKLKKAARERAEKSYSWEKVTDAYEGILKGLTEASR
jgi:N-acetylglucosaminyldiphosphoundecaprenol N-acetyl-beta-D-mannosaminyltransferase